MVKPILFSMPKINFNFNSDKAASEIYTKVKGFLTSEDGIKKFDPKVSFDFADTDFKGTAHGTGFKAVMSVASKDKGCQVNLEIDLSFLLTPLKSKVEQFIEKKLSKILS